jgi:hypothetical protein
MTWPDADAKFPVIVRFFSLRDGQRYELTLQCGQVTQNPDEQLCFQRGDFKRLNDSGPD